jgi:hypothetical protein
LDPKKWVSRKSGVFDMALFIKSKPPNLLKSEVCVYLPAVNRREAPVPANNNKSSPHAFNKIELKKLL